MLNILTAYKVVLTSGGRERHSRKSPLKSQEFSQRLYLGTEWPRQSTRPSSSLGLGSVEHAAAGPTLCEDFVTSAQHLRLKPIIHLPLQQEMAKRFAII